jgi:PKHD-type hydroxylase
MILKRPYFEYKSSFDSTEIETIIKLGESLEPKQAKTYGVKENYRDSHVAWIEKSPETNWLYSKCINLMKQVNQTADWNFDHRVIEKLQYTRYGVGQHYNWHSDQRTEPYTLQEDKHLNGMIRKISFTLMLDSDYEGGQLQFEYGLPESENRIKTINTQKGLTVFFPSFMMHRVAPVTKGIRRSLVGWVCGPPYV